LTKRNYDGWYNIIMLKVYLETTIFNRFLEESRDYHIETRKLFDKILGNEIQAYSSAYVIEEIDKASEPKRSEMLSLIQKYNIAVLKIDQRAYDLSNIYIEMGIIPLKFRIDGIHIAMAAIYDMDCIVSLNFHHINKLKTKMATEIIHRMKGYNNPFICTPMEVIDYE
jgi:predicted nucleic acid-binding protein